MAQEWSLTPQQPAAVAPKGKGAIVTGVVLLLAGIVAVVVGIVGVAGSAADLVREFGSPLPTPLDVQRPLTGGTT
ncbi:MAG: hypothetical protein GC157_11895 [Frankiales bacterium]|nr:hypothetical protein [Frankiales bacterium]